VVHATIRLDLTPLFILARPLPLLSLLYCTRLSKIVLSIVESWDKRESNLKKRGHLLTAAELKRRGITRYDAEMLLSQGFSLPEPKTTVRSPARNKTRLKCSTPKRFSPRIQARAPVPGTHSNQSTPRSTRALPGTKTNECTPRSAGGLQKPARKRIALKRQNHRRPVSRPLRRRTARHQLKFGGSSKPDLSASAARNRARTRRLAQHPAKHTDSDRLDFGDDEDTGSSSESSADSCEHSERAVKVDMALSMSCDDVDVGSSPWMIRSTANSRTCTETVLTPSKLRARPRQPLTTARHSDDCMPLLKKESTVSAETSTPSLVIQKKVQSSDGARGDDMPVLEKEQEEDRLPFGADSSVDSGWTSNTDKSQSASSLAGRCRRHLGVVDRRFGYDTREWRVPKLTIRRRRASGQSPGNSAGVISSTSLSSGGVLIYEILPSCGRGSVESQPSSDDSSYSDQKSTTATSSPDSISPSCFYGDGTAGLALKRLRLKFGEESVAIDVGLS